MQKGHDFGSKSIQGKCLPTNKTEIPKASSRTRRRNECLLTEGCMKCNVLATRVRRRIKLFLFSLGCWIQKHNLLTFVTGFILLLGLCVGLKKASEETNIERLWVQAGGRLQKELDYTERFLGGSEFTASIEVFIQKYKWGSQNILHVESVEEHLKMMKRIVDMEVYVHQDLWKLSDLCQKPNFGEIGNSYFHFDRFFEHFVPCYIITPLDCFWEGSKILGPSSPMRVPILRQKITWSNVDPWKLVDDLVAANVSIPFKRLKKIFERAGIQRGYMDKPCLNPRSKDCPHARESGVKKPLPDIGKIMKNGCTGFASKIMKWPRELIVGGDTTDHNGMLKSAQAFQSVIFLLSPNDVFRKHRHSKGRSVSGWSPHKAEQVVKAWQRKYTKMVNGMGFNNDSTSTQMMAFSSTSFYDLITNFSKTNLMQIALGYGLMALYAIITLKRWTDSVLSYGLVGLIGVVVVSLSVGAALGLSSLLKVSFNAASTQVLPFLALGLGVDDMFIVARAYVNISESDKTDETELLGECLEQSGLSIALTSFTNAVAFTMASVVPVPALQDFSRQAALIVVFNFLSVLFVFTSTLAFDIKRIKQQSYDLFVCFGRERPQMTPQLSHRNVPQDIAFINLEGVGDVPSICAGASVAAYIEKDKTAPGKSFTIRTDGHKVNLESPWSNQSVNGRAAEEGGKKDGEENDSKLCAILKKISFSYFADVYLSVWIQSVPVKVVVLCLFAIFLGICAYGAFQVTSGLDPSEMVPRGSAEHAFTEAQFKYFSFFQVYAVSMENVDYPNKQKLLYDFHQSLRRVDNIVTDKTHWIKPFWLMYFRDWLLDKEKTFQKEWNEGKFHQYGWHGNASKDAVLGYKLMLVSGNDKRPQDFSRIPNSHLVDQNGIISPSRFYHYLTAWYNVDVMGYQASEMGLRPKPPVWNNFLDDRIPLNSTENLIPKSPPIQIAFMPFYANSLHQNKDFIKLIKDVRNLCEDFTAKGLPIFPFGTPFTYWEQYTNLSEHLWLAVGLIFCVTFIVLAITLMNVWAAAITTVVLASITFELFGVIGLLGLKLSAVPVVTVIMSVGIGVEFTVHICLAFISAQGNRNQRVKTAITQLFSPILDGVMSTVVGIVILAGSEFDFIRRYFFHLILALVLIGAANGLLLLPVLLSFFGPCCEVTHRRVNPTSQGTTGGLTTEHSTAGDVALQEHATAVRTSMNDFILQTLESEPTRLPKTVRNSIDPRSLSQRGRGSESVGSLRSARDPFNFVPSAKDNTSSRTRRSKNQNRAKTTRFKLSPVPEVSTPDSADPERISRTSTSTSRPSRPGTPITSCLTRSYHTQLTEPEAVECHDSHHDSSLSYDHVNRRGGNVRPRSYVEDWGGESEHNAATGSRGRFYSDFEDDDIKSGVRPEYYPEYVSGGDRIRNAVPGRPHRITEVESLENGTEKVTKVTATATVTVEVCSKQSNPHRVRRVYHSQNDEGMYGCVLPDVQ